ncbi:hypothetical protein C4D60_Mb02t19070 [Musa balbisiana]|uniref:Uncharacterized protein n=1 Tax=Musa balbisiana TaxID=52838 RepID=A0A4S8IE52_MUSBA|nr:hypothetical protein C4D60_Mb02t19070 [Musa balbisiana]
MPEMDKCRKMMDQEGFLRQRAAKLQEQLRRQERDNRELEVSLLMHQAVAGRSLYDVNIEDATSLAWMVDAKLKSVQDRINQQTTQLALAAEASASSQVTAKDPIEMAMDSLQRQNWLLDAMHPRENVIFGGGGGEEITPISCVEYNSSWLDLYFPFN